MKFRMQGDLLPDGGKNEDSMISHVFLNCVDLHSDLPDKWNTFKKANPDGDMDVDITLLIDGKEVDVSKFFNHLWGQYAHEVEKDAEKLVKERLSEKVISMMDKLNDVNEVLDMWCSDISWDAPNPFVINEKTN